VVAEAEEELAVVALGHLEVVQERERDCSLLLEQQTLHQLQIEAQVEAVEDIFIVLEQLVVAGAAHLELL
jgi:hypothetical protein